MEVSQLEKCGHAVRMGIASMGASGRGSEARAGTARLCAAVVCTAPRCIIARTQRLLKPPLILSNQVAPKGTLMMIWTVANLSSTFVKFSKRKADSKHVGLMYIFKMPTLRGLVIPAAELCRVPASLQQKTPYFLVFSDSWGKTCTLCDHPDLCHLVDCDSVLLLELSLAKFSSTEDVDVILTDQLPGEINSGFGVPERRGNKFPTHNNEQVERDQGSKGKQPKIFQCLMMPVLLPRSVSSCFEELCGSSGQRVPEASGENFNLAFSTSVSVKSHLLKTPEKRVAREGAEFAPCCLETAEVIRTEPAEGWQTASMTSCIHSQTPGQPCSLLFQLLGGNKILEDYNVTITQLFVDIMSVDPSVVHNPLLSKSEMEELPEIAGRSLSPRQAEVNLTQHPKVSDGGYGDDSVDKELGHSRGNTMLRDDLLCCVECSTVLAEKQQFSSQPMLPSPARELRVEFLEYIVPGAKKRPVIHGE
ncbi:hypothetical protein ACRRTK_022733 [Alexandromys fortis]